MGMKTSEKKVWKRIKCKSILAGENLNLLENVLITINGSKIIAVEELRRDLSSEAEMAIPSFINAHVHVGDSFAKDLARGMPLPKIVAPPDGLKHELLRTTRKSTIVEGIKASIREMIINGSSSFIDFRENAAEGFHLVKKAIEEEKAARYIFPRILVRPLMNKKSIQECQTIINENPGFAAGFNFSSPNNIDDEHFNYLKEIMRKNGKLLFATHVAETRKNPEKSFVKFSKTDTERVIDYLGHYKNRILLVHANFMSNQELKKVKEKNINIVFCSRIAAMFSNLNTSRDDSIYLQAIKENVNCALGTDNVMLNSPNMFQEINFFMRMMLFLHPDIDIKPSSILKMVTINPARMLGIDDKVGSISPGKEASFMLINLKDPTFHDSKDIVSSIILRANPSHVKNLFFKGKVVPRS
ncbi:MAG: amidohydrolase family protein [Promethearchaeota archaeon]